ncbi:MAG: DUF4340 domain-containing protein [Kiritimatiellaeota bacterium]|nr:DUF4340 domain-containing protein [Kiritimatiellota bacterium]
MTTKKLITLAAAAAVLGGLAYMSSNAKKLKTPALAGKPVLKTLDLEAVQRIEVSDNGQKGLTLESTDAGWVVSSLFGYPADITKIRENLLALADLKIGQVAKGKKLGDARLVDLQDAAGKSLATLRLGEMKMREATGQMAMYGGGAYPDGRYVATEGDAVYLVKETLDAFDGDPNRWIDTQLAAVPVIQITSAEFTVEGERLTLAKNAGTWALDGLGEGEELDASKLHGIDSVLGRLSFSAVADPALTDEQLGFTTGAVFRVALTGGETYTATLGAAAGADRYFKISAAFTPEDIPVEPAEGEDPNPAVRASKLSRNAKIAEMVNDFNAIAGKWVYLIPAYTADAMTKRRADVVKPKEPPKPEEEAPGSE